jgi:hypothetical protein
MPLQTATKCRSKGIVGWGALDLQTPFTLQIEVSALPQTLGSAAAQLI